ncbi:MULTISPECIES: hypothetical protein [Chromobacterium]|uniref:Lipoprotein n=1 Tax=Chromobacterium aquaticum TaxID=467180 RepID=A0ABV8ZVH7_9NEIS|nr:MULTISPECIES: hypothetical protein [Chromobacterium]KMN30160.1 lipoprotein [Chromobacterium sp. LK1]MCD5363772.1 hypothetical protein [Chromobacterium aquaticum]
MSLRPLLPLAALLLSACAYTPVQKPVAGDDFRGNELGQSSANRMANLAMRDNLASLQTLLEKLYKRNPKEWRKAGAADYPSALRQVMAAIRNNTPLPALRGQRSIAAMSTAFDPGFGGDRAGALIYGIGSMLVDAYGGRTELFLVHGLDAQQLANASHNLEVAAWMLNNRQISGAPVLLSNEIGSVRNLSFEREFGKMMARLDLLAELSDEKLRRSAIDFGQSLIAGPFLQFLPVSAAAQAAAP